jgi:hypothetical protein
MMRMNYQPHFGMTLFTNKKHPGLAVSAIPKSGSQLEYFELSKKPGPNARTLAVRVTPIDNTPNTPTGNYQFTKQFNISFFGPFYALEDNSSRSLRKLDVDLQTDIIQFANQQP